MTFYGLADYRLADSEFGEVVEFFASRDEAAEALRQVLADEPDWADDLEVIAVELADVSPN
jgi:hypothetical protein